MKVYKVNVRRTSYAIAEITVEAESAEEANRKALDEAGDHEYSETDAEYDVAEGAYTTVRCCLCNKDTAAKTAHLHQDSWIGDECWDERLRASE